MRLPKLNGTAGTIKARVLAIALIPSIAIMVLGVALAGYLVNQGLQVRAFAQNVGESLGPTTRFIVAVQEERRLSTLKVTELPYDPAALRSQRNRVDVALEAMAATTRELAASAPDELSEPLRELDLAAAGVPEMRKNVDDRVADAKEVYEFYGELTELAGAGIQGIARSASDAEVAFEQMISYDLFRSSEAQARAHVLVERAIAKGLNPKEFHQLAHQMGTYHELLETIVPRMTGYGKTTYAAMQETPWWKTLVDGDNSIMAKGPGKHSVEFDLAAWENASKQLSDGLIGLYRQHSQFAADLAAAAGSATLISALGAGVAILVVAAVAMVIALRLSRSLIGRLETLRVQTLNLADNELPAVIARLGEGQRVDIEAEVPWLAHGEDEIGQLADAFNKAQRTAIDVAVKEAETRHGVRSVFLNIAHRSQVMVHRQLKVLDQAERKEDDPDQLQLLFQLDHLATRSRRNAENLLILGGEQAGRQWRNPVDLREIIRAAIAETEQYTRVVTGALPELLVDGSVVADLGHLLAELVDNGTAFSPPQSRVEVRGNQVGRGVVVEIEDQGLGIEAEQLEQINAMLRNPPDFSVMALSNESRIGLFVVARLALRHGIKIALRESIYGGTRAIVLVPSSLIATESTVDARLESAGALEPAPAELDSETTAVAESLMPAGVEATVLVTAVDAPAAAQDSGTDDPAAPWGRKEIEAERVPVHTGYAADDVHAEAAARYGLGHTGNGHGANGNGNNGANGNGHAYGGNGNGNGNGNGSHGHRPHGGSGNGAGGNGDGTGQSSVAVEGGAPTEVLALPAIGWPAVMGEVDESALGGVTLPSGLGLSRTRAAAAPAGDRKAAPAGDRPSLPRRKRQANIAPQLREEPAPEVPTQSTSEPEEIVDTAERSRSAMSAFQRGTQRARVAEPETTP